MKRETAEKAERILKALRDQERQRLHIHDLYKLAKSGDLSALDELTNATLSLNQRITIDLEGTLGAL